MAAIRQVTVGSVARIAAIRLAVNVAMPHRRGTAEDTTASRNPDARSASPGAMGHPHRAPEPALSAALAEAAVGDEAGVGAVDRDARTLTKPKPRSSLPHTLQLAELASVLYRNCSPPMLRSR